MNETKCMNDFTEEEIDLGDKAFIECMAHIKHVVSEYLDKDEIKFEIWSAIRDGVAEFLGENCADFATEVAQELARQMEDSITLNIEVKNKCKK